jgi:potassium voltage-gated channel Eag-related subfamily H protein 7
VATTISKFKEAPWYIIRPTSLFMSCWDAVTSIALIITALATPFEVAFLDNDGVDALFLMNRIIDVIFIVDMALAFFLMYRIETGGGEADSSGTQWEHRLKYIARHYLKGWFSIDVVSIVPSLFDILPLVPGNLLSRTEGCSNAASQTQSLKVMRVVRAARLIKLVRLMRGSRLLKRWRTRISMSFAQISIISLTFELFMSSHWLACVLSLQTLFAPKTESWFGTFGWCIEDTVTETECEDEVRVVCVATGELYLVCLNWAFKIVAGFGSSPNNGPYKHFRQMRFPDDPSEPPPVLSGGQDYTTAEQVTSLIWTMLSALGRAYITAKLVAIIAHGNPDWTEFKHRMDKLNRYINYYKLDNTTAMRLREYFFETRTQQEAKSRNAIVREMTFGLQELVSKQVNQRWLQTVPFFRGLTMPNGRTVALPVESAFLAKVAVALDSNVFAPTELPPTGKLYVIVKGNIRYKGLSRGPGYCWGALDVMLPNVGNVMPVATAIALDYVHVLHVDGKTLRSLAQDFPESLRTLRMWTMINGIKEYMLHVLRTATDEERRAAAEWVAQDNRARRMGSEPGTVKVCVLRGSNLMAMDKGGRSDPYVVVQAAGMVPATPKKVKTSAKKGTVNPEWGETLELNVPEAPCPLHLEVFDHDNVGRDDAMGNALVLPAQCANIHATTEMTLELSTQGTIEVEVTWERSIALPAAVE